MSIGMWRFGFVLWVMIVLVQMDGYKSCIEKERKALLELKAFVISLYLLMQSLIGVITEEATVVVDVISRRIIGLSLNNIVGLSINGLGFSDYASLNLSLLHPFKELKRLNLSMNYFGSLIDYREGYKSLRRLPKLEILDLSSNVFNSTILPFLRYATSLKALFLGKNNVETEFPMEVLKNMTSLEVLDLSYNYFNDTLPRQGLENLHKLKALDLSNNQFSGQYKEFANGGILWQINLSGNKFKGSLPASVGEMKNIHFLDLSYNDFSGNLPRSLFVECHFLERLKLSHNRFDGQIFQESTNLTWLTTVFVDNNMFTGNIGNGLLNSSLLSWLDMSNNFFTGTVPSWMGEFYWEILLISDNLLEGSIPSTLFHSPNLELVDLSRNTLSGSITSHFSNSSQSRGLLYLHDNFLTGSLPETLVILDVRNNQLYGSIPQFVNASDIGVLLLRGNDLTGPIPRQLCTLSSIRILDLAYNKLNESIPSCLSNLSFGLENKEDLNFLGVIYTLMDDDLGIYFESILELDQIDVGDMYDLNYSVEFAAKQRYDSYISGTLGYMFGLDLSNNELSGEIPHELGYLFRARSLNLSHNSLVGSIPESFSKMKDIESLDLSFNKLYGPIPIALTSLNSLAVFNVSYNNLSGTIPQGKQFNTFGENSYFGNLRLCGPPTNRSCDTNNPEEPDEETVDDGTSIDAEAFYWSLGMTYATVLVGFTVFMCFNSPWRQGWFRLVDAFICLVQNKCT